MLVGKCPVCGACYYGWALKTPERRTCLNCGTPLGIGEFNGCIPADKPPHIADFKVKEPLIDITSPELDDCDDTNDR
jgi:hypothetical protein